MAEVLKESVQRKNAAFEKFLQQIPAQFYLSGMGDDSDLDEEIHVDDGMYRQLARNGLEGQELEEALWKRNHKLAKYDPDAKRSIVDIQKSKGEKKDKNVEQSKEELLMERKRIAASRQDKKLRLQEMKAANGTQHRGNKVKGLTKEERELRKAASLTNEPEKAGAPASHAQPGADEPSGETMPVDAPSGPAEGHAPDFDFSTLDLTDGSAQKKGKKLANDPKAALEKLHKHKAYLEKLTEDKREQVEERDKWQSAETRIAGGKVRDDEKRLNKMAKRLEKQKSKRQAAWADRVEKLNAAQQARAAKRQANISSKAEAKKNKRLGVKPKSPASAKARSKGRPGFEGKRKSK